MKEIIARKPGLAEPEETADPGKAPRRGSVRVKVRYAGVGYADVMAVRGRYLLAPSRPFSPGYEFLGIVESINAAKPPEAPGIAVGTRVAGILPRMGAYREFLDVDPRLIAPVPDALTDESAALLPLNYLTALAMIERLARLRPGQSFLVRGAAGGVGTAVLELGRLAGLRAYGAASKGKHALVEELGGIALAREDARRSGSLGRLEPDGVDAVFDAFGAASFRESWEAIGPGGILVCYGLAPAMDSGWAESLRSLAFIARRALAGGGKRVALCSMPAIAARDPGWTSRALEAIFARAARGEIKPVLGGVYPWDRVAEAHRALEAGSVRGKLLLDFLK